MILVDHCHRFDKYRFSLVDRKHNDSSLRKARRSIAPNIIEQFDKIQESTDSISSYNFENVGVFYDRVLDRYKLLNTNSNQTDPGRHLSKYDNTIYGQNVFVFYRLCGLTREMSNSSRNY